MGNVRRWCETWAYLTMFGILAGGLAGLLEALLSMTRGASLVGWKDLFPIAVFYSLCWGGAGAGVGFLLFLVSLGRRQAPAASTVRGVAAPFLFCSLLFVLVGGYVNSFYLPTMFSRSSLLFDLGWLLCCGLLFFVMVRFGRKKTAPERPLLRLGSVFTACFVVFLLLIAALGLLPGDQERSERRTGGKHAGDLNILFVLLDALRRDHLGCYGYERPTSPNIDRLAGQGVLFERAYANAPLTKESTATLMTSLYPSTHNVRRLADGLPRSAVTLMEAMQEAGYRTAILSANPMVSPLFGFDRGVDYFYVHRVPVTDQTVLAHSLYRVATAVPGMTWLAGAVAAGLSWLAPPREGDAFRGGSPERLSQALLEWVDRKGDGNFFAYLHYMVPHAPYAPSPPFDGLFGPDDPADRLTDPPAYGAGLLPFVEGRALEEPRRQGLVRQYDRCIAYGDAQLATLLEGLRSRGLADKTLVIVTADHGEEFYEHRGWGHGHSLFEELVRVPLIFWLPGVLEAGTRIETPVQGVDLMPTILGAAGVDQTELKDLEGRNLWPALRDNLPLPERPWVFCEVFHGSHFARALIDGQSKIIYARHEGDERSLVFDLAGDPLERRDLAPSRPDLKEELLSRMNGLHQELVARQKNISAQQIDRETLDRLKSLGYVQ